MYTAMTTTTGTNGSDATFSANRGEHHKHVPSADAMQIAPIVVPRIYSHQQKCNETTMEKYMRKSSRLPRSVVRAFLDRDLHGLLILIVGVILLRVAGAVNFLADLLVLAAPVVVLASGITISGFAPHTTRGVVDQWGGAGGAGCEDHCFVVV
jgi:hypothetical protein